MSYDLGQGRADLRAGLVCAGVVVPLALAFGVVSGLGPVAGLWGAVAVGFVTAVLGGTRLQISGPTAAVAIAVSLVLASHADSIAHALAIVFIAGVIQVLLGLMRLGNLVRYIPHSVNSGFMSGIGVLLVLSQVLPFLGAEPLGGNPLDGIGRWPEAVRNMDFHALGLAVTTLVVCVGWPKRWRPHVPAPAGALACAMVLTAVLFDGAPRLGEAVAAPDFWSMQMGASGFWSAVGAAVTIALVATLNSGLQSPASDAMTGHRHDPNRELIAAGLANSAAAMFGGMPGAAAGDATNANIRAGAQTRAAGALAAVAVLVLAVALGGWLDEVPGAALAAIAVWMGLRLIDWRMLTRLHRVQIDGVLVMLATLGLTVFVDLLAALAVGIAAAALAASRRLEQLEFDSVISVPVLDAVFFADSDSTASPDITKFDAYSARVGMVKMGGSFTVASSNRLRAAISKDIQEHEVVILDFTETSYIDDSAALVLEQLIDAAAEHGTECIVIGLDGLRATSVSALDVLHLVPGDHFVASFDEARAIAARLLEINLESQSGSSPDQSSRPIR